MGYAPWWCANQFTPQQQHRMHCWARAALGSMIAVAGGRRAAGQRGALRRCGRARSASRAGRARVWFATPAAGHVSLALFDVRGRRVVTLVDREETSGRHALQWDGHDGAGRRVSPGVYWLRLSLGNQVRVGPAGAGVLIERTAVTADGGRGHASHPRTAALRRRIRPVSHSRWHPRSCARPRPVAAPGRWPASVLSSSATARRTMSSTSSVAACDWLRVIVVKSS
jgi:hypothetical protein